MDIVADTNIFLAVALEEASKERIVDLTSECQLHGPEILAYEIGNALSAMVKRRQVTPEDVLPIYQITQRIPVRLIEVNVPKSLVIATDHNLYAYDAYFLYCATKLGCPLITLDRRLITVAKAMKIQVLEIT